MKISEEMKTILDLVAKDKTNEEISIQLNYSKSTVKRRIKELFDIYGVDSRIKLTKEYLLERML